MVLAGLGAIVLPGLVLKAKRRLELSRGKHPSLGGHAKMSRRVAKLLPFYEYDEAGFFNSDDAPAEVVALRRAGFFRLAGIYQQRFAASAALTAEAQEAVSDLQFTSAYRVPFQYSRFLRQHLKGGAFLEASSGVTVTDLDGNVFYDLGGAYGVNVFGYDFYKECMALGSERVEALGPVLGAYHPLLAYNVKRLQAISADFGRSCSHRSVGRDQ